MNSNNCSVSVTEERGEEVEEVKEAKKEQTDLRHTHRHSLHHPYFKPRRHELKAEKQDGSSPQGRTNKGNDHIKNKDKNHSNR